jgi:hypothetical protein
VDDPREKTTDVDLYLPRAPAVDGALARLGFDKKGRHWALPARDLFIEAPAEFKSERERAADIELSNGEKVLVLSIEDVVIDRLHQFLAGGHRDVAEQAVTLLQNDVVDHDRLRVRADEEGLTSVLRELERLSERVRGGELIETFELHEIANRLRQQR